MHFAHPVLLLFNKCQTCQVSPLQQHDKNLHSLCVATWLCPSLWVPEGLSTCLCVCEPHSANKVHIHQDDDTVTRGSGRRGSRRAAVAAVATSAQVILFVWFFLYLSQKPKSGATRRHNFSGAGHRRECRPSVKICWGASTCRAPVWMWAQSARGSARCSVELNCWCSSFMLRLSLIFISVFAAHLSLDVASVFAERS